jgi:hypothetical protein
MAGKKQLPPVRIVKDGEKATPDTVSESIARGTRLDELKAMRRVLAAHIDNENTLARDLAPLMRQARDISSEIEAILARESEEAEESDIGEDEEWDAEAI